MLQIGIFRQKNDWHTLAEKSNLYLSFSDRWTVSSNERAFAYLRGLRSNCIISGTIKWCRIMSGMVAYCRVAVDHLLKMWKSLTPKSLYREDVNPVNLRSEARFAIELCFGAISIRNRGRPARPWLPWLARMHFPNARTWRKQVVTYWTHDFQKQIPVINLLCAISIRNRAWPARLWLVRLALAMHFANACTWEMQVLSLSDSRLLFCGAKCVPACLASGKPFGQTSQHYAVTSIHASNHFPTTWKFRGLAGKKACLQNSYNFQA